MGHRTPIVHRVALGAISLLFLAGVGAGAIYLAKWNNELIAAIKVEREREAEEEAWQEQVSAMKSSKRETMSDVYKVFGPMSCSAIREPQCSLPPPGPCSAPKAVCSAEVGRRHSVKVWSEGSRDDALIHRVTME